MSEVVVLHRRLTAAKWEPAPTSATGDTAKNSRKALTSESPPITDMLRPRGNALRLPNAAKSLSGFGKKIADGRIAIAHRRPRTALAIRQCSCSAVHCIQTFASGCRTHRERSMAGPAYGAPPALTGGPLGGSVWLARNPLTRPLTRVRQPHHRGPHPG